MNNSPLTRLRQHLPWAAVQGSRRNDQSTKKRLTVSVPTMSCSQRTTNSRPRSRVDPHRSITTRSQRTNRTYCRHRLHERMLLLSAVYFDQHPSPIDSQEVLRRERASVFPIPWLHQARLFRSIVNRLEMETTIPIPATTVHRWMMATGLLNHRSESAEWLKIIRFDPQTISRPFAVKAKQPLSKRHTGPVPKWAERLDRMHRNKTNVIIPTATWTSTSCLSMAERMMTIVKTPVNHLGPTRVRQHRIKTVARPTTKDIRRQTRRVWHTQHPHQNPRSL